MRAGCAPLGEVAEVSAGGGAPQDPQSFGTVGFPFIRAGSLTKLTSGGNENSLEKLSDAVARKHRLRLFPEGAVVFAKSGMSATKGLVHKLRQPSYVVNHLAAIVCGARLDPTYLSYFLRFSSPAKLVQDAAYPSVRLADISGIDVPLPPLPEQRRIATIMDKADELRTKRRAALEQLNGLTQSLFLEMCGDPATNPCHFPMMSLKDLFAFRTGKLDSNAAVANGRYPFFTCSRDDLRIDDYAFDCEALLLAGNNANADYSVKHYSGRFNAYQRTYVVTLRDATYSYEFARFALEYQLAEMKRRSKGTGTKYLTLEILNRMSIPVPPVEVQHEFSRRLAAASRVRLIHHSSMELLEDLFSGLQSRAFAGEL